MSEAEQTNEQHAESREGLQSGPCSSWYRSWILVGFVLLLTAVILLYDFLHSGEVTVFGLFSSSPSHQMSTKDEPLPAPYQTISLPPTSSIDQNEGEELYKDNCIACHGEDGSGHGPVAEGLSPQPQSFNDSSFLQQHSNRYLFWRISEGKQGSAMPSFKQTLSKHERWQIVHYLRVLQSD